MPNSSPWRQPVSQKFSPPKSLYHLQHTMSVADFNQTSWAPRPSSPDASSSSSSSFDDGALTPTASSPYSSASRGRTPTPTSPGPQFSTPSYTENPGSRTNPWSPSFQPSSPPISPRSAPRTPRDSPPSRSPPSHSRSVTPVAAPQPLYPFRANPQMVPFRHELQRQVPTPSPHHEVEEDADLKLPVQFISSSLILAMLPVWPGKAVAQKLRCSNFKIVYQWCISNPRTALLLWMCDSLQSCVPASFYQLKDSMLPYNEAQLKGIARNPAKVANMQWKVAIKQLPRNGEHTEFQIHDTVPLGEVKGSRGIAAHSTTPSKSLTCVRYLDGSTDDVYVRKRLELRANRPQDKDAILSQIRSFNRLHHPHIARIVSSYAQGSVVSFVTPLANSDLDDYLNTFSGRSHTAELLAWIHDLADALHYMHYHRVSHRAIRPHKILIDHRTNRILFAAFGIAHPVRLISAAGGVLKPYSTDPAYVYAPPELILHSSGSSSPPSHSLHRSNGSQSSSSGYEPLPADVFSLGCVFLDMLSNTRPSHSTKTSFTDYRAEYTADLSFHANLDRCRSWIERLRCTTLSPRTATDADARDATAAPRRRGADVHAQAVSAALSAVADMLHHVPAHRPTMRKVLQRLSEGPSGAVARQRRKSFDIVGLEMAAAKAAAGIGAAAGGGIGMGMGTGAGAAGGFNSSSSSSSSSYTEGEAAVGGGGAAPPRARRQAFVGSVPVPVEALAQFRMNNGQDVWSDLRDLQGYYTR